MKEFKIEAQHSIILEVVKALKYNCSGMGLRKMYDIKIERNSYHNCKVIFTAREGREINPLDFFYFGLHMNI